MDDLISRQAAIECLKTKIAEIFFKETAEKNVEKWLNELPTVQPEQKTGRWVTQFDGTLHYCSECGWALMDTESGDLPYMGIDYHRSNEERWTCCPEWCEELMNYCPNCGAKMEGVK